MPILSQGLFCWSKIHPHWNSWNGFDRSMPWSAIDNTEACLEMSLEMPQGWKVFEPPFGLIPDHKAWEQILKQTMFWLPKSPTALLHSLLQRKKPHGTSVPGKSDCCLDSWNKKRVAGVDSRLQMCSGVAGPRSTQYCRVPFQLVSTACRERSCSPQCFEARLVSLLFCPLHSKVWCV